MRPAEKSSGPWSRYWRTGVLHSCTSGEGSGVFSEEFWKRLFAGVEGPVRLVDVGTGNGLVPLLATRCLGSRATIYGIDAAQIHPEATRHPELAEVEFMPGVVAEQLPFDSSSIDVLTAQFALEYADIPASLDEAVRVLAPKGRIALVMHAHDSRISTVSRAQLEQISWLLRPEGFLDSARAMIQVLASRRTSGVDDGSHALVRQRYNEVATELIGKLDRQKTGDVLARAAIAVQRALAAAASGAGAEEIARLEHLAGEFEDEALRLKEQLAAARTPDQVRELEHRLGDAGMQVVTDSLHQHGQLMAYTIVAKR